MRVVAGGDYDADWDEFYAPPSPEPLQRVPRVYSFEAMTSRSL